MSNNINKDNYINNIKKENIKYIYDDKNIKIEKENIYINKYFDDDINSFSKLIGRINSVRGTSSPRRTSSTLPPRVTPQATTDFTSRWSPISNADTIYKYDRGVIGIGLSGEKKEIILDRTFRHHNDATMEIGQLLHSPADTPDLNPFAVAVDVVSKGAIIIQLEGNSIFIYLPDTISLEQYQILLTEINPRRAFETIAFYHNGEVYDEIDITMDKVIDFCNNIINQKRSMGR